MFFKHKLIPQISEKRVNPEIVYLPAVKVCYQSIRTDYANKEIENLWDNLMTQSQPSFESAYFGIIADESLITDKIKCRYYACISHPVTTHSLAVKTVFGRKYAKFMHSGSYNNLEDTYALIYSNWILSTQLQFSPSPITELYLKHDSNTTNEKDYLTAILIPLHS